MRYVQTLEGKHFKLIDDITINTSPLDRKEGVKYYKGDTARAVSSALEECLLDGAMERGLMVSFSPTNSDDRNEYLVPVSLLELIPLVSEPAEAAERVVNEKQLDPEETTPWVSSEETDFLECLRLITGQI